MPPPGEVNHVIGAAYQSAFIGALQASIPGFESSFEVQTTPEKMTFKAPTGKQYSFDFVGVYDQKITRAEVFGECKGYTAGAGLLPDFRSFLAKAYVTSTAYDSHRNDHFWFITNVPFGCSEGSGIRNYEYISKALADREKPEVHAVLGEAHVDPKFVWSLASRIGIFILTDSFLTSTQLTYRVKHGDNIWSILKKLHGRSLNGFGNIAQEIAAANNLRSPDQIVTGRKLKLTWRGIPGVAGGGRGGF